MFSEHSDSACEENGLKGPRPGFEPGLGDPQSPMLTMLHYRGHMSPSLELRPCLVLGRSTPFVGVSARGWIRSESDRIHPER